MHLFEQGNKEITLTLHILRNLQVLAIESQIPWVKMHSSCEYGSRTARYFIAAGRKWGWEITKSSSIERSHITVVTSEGTTFDDWKIVIFKTRN